MLLAAAPKGEPAQQGKVVHRGHEISFALSVLAKLELVSDFFDGANAAFSQDLKQKFETGRLKTDVLDAFAPHDEKS